MNRVDSFEMLLRQFDEVRETLGRLEARARNQCCFVAESILAFSPQILAQG